MKRFPKTSTRPGTGWLTDMWGFTITFSGTHLFTAPAGYDEAVTPIVVIPLEET